MSILFSMHMYYPTVVSSSLFTQKGRDTNPALKFIPYRTYPADPAFHSIDRNYANRPR